MSELPEDDGLEEAVIPLDRETRARLVALARATNRHPAVCASLLLRDMLRDDEAANVTALKLPLNS